MKITIYTINDCKFSQQEKEYLNSKNLQFEEKNLEENKEYLTEMLQMSNNFAGTPVTRIEDDAGKVTVIKGFTQDEFDKVLGGSAPAQTAAPQPSLAMDQSMSQPQPPVQPVVPQQSVEPAQVQPQPAEPMQQTQQPVSSEDLQMNAEENIQEEVNETLQASAPQDEPTAPQAPQPQQPSQPTPQPQQPPVVEQPAPEPQMPQADQNTQKQADDALNAVLQNLQQKVQQSQQAPAPQQPEQVQAPAPQPQDPLQG